MFNITSFEFESKSVRVVTDENGETLFVANDVAVALGYKDNVNAIKQHCRGVVKHHTILDALGHAQEARVIHESDVYRLVAGSNLPEAQRFEAWLFEEVLPKIHKTGTYAHPSRHAALSASTQDRIAAILMIGEAVAKVPGVKQGIAMAATLTCIAENTGIGVESMRRSLPAYQNTQAPMNATSLGELLGLPAEVVNLRLVAMGFQHCNKRDEWELADAGRGWGVELPYSYKGHFGYRVLWLPAVLDLLQKVA